MKIALHVKGDKNANYSRWRWFLKDENANNIAMSTGSFATEEEAKKAMYDAVTDAYKTVAHNRVWCVNNPPKRDNIMPEPTLYRKPPWWRRRFKWITTSSGLGN